MDLSARSLRAPAAGRAARKARQIRARGNLLEAGCAQQSLYGCALVPSVLNQQPATLVQVTWCRGNDLPHGLQSIAAGAERQKRFVSQIRQMRVCGGDVRRVGYRQVKAPIADGPPPGTLSEHQLQAQSLGVGCSP